MRKPLSLLLLVAILGHVFSGGFWSVQAAVSDSTCPTKAAANNRPACCPPPAAAPEPACCDSTPHPKPVPQPNAGSCKCSEPGDPCCCLRANVMAKVLETNVNPSPRFNGPLLALEQPADFFTGSHCPAFFEPFWMVIQKGSVILLKSSLLI